MSADTLRTKLGNKIISVFILSGGSFLFDGSQVETPRCRHLIERVSTRAVVVVVVVVVVAQSDCLPTLVRVPQA